jgi:hypothetical protein
MHEILSIKLHQQNFIHLPIETSQMIFYAFNTWNLDTFKVKNETVNMLHFMYK